MSHSRHHDWSRGPTRRLFEARRYRVIYRARRLRGEGGTPSTDWQRGQMRFVVRPAAEDPEGLRALDRAIQRAREMRTLELEVLEIVDDGEEQAVSQMTDAGQKAKVVSDKEYAELEAKRKIVYPGHPLWNGRFEG